MTLSLCSLGRRRAPRLAARASNRSAFITLEMWIEPSRSTMAPCGCCWLLRMCRLIIFTPSTITRCFLPQHGDDLAALAFVGAGDHHHFVALFDVKLCA